MHLTDVLADSVKSVRYLPGAWYVGVLYFPALKQLINAILISGIKNSVKSPR